MTQQQVRQRLFLFQVLVVLAFGLLTVQLWRIQVLGGSTYQTLSQQNSIAPETIDAPRGVIYDRQGRIVVRNRPSFRATLLPARVVNETWLLWGEEEWRRAGSMLTEVAELLQIPLPAGNHTSQLRAAFNQASGQLLSEDIDKLCQAGKLFECFSEALITAPYRPITIQKDIPRDAAFTVMEHSINLPGLTIVSESQREYLYGSLYAHLLGYELPIPKERLERQTRFTTNRYLPTDRIGVAGIESGYEEALRGTRGVRTVERNVVGRQVRVIEQQPAIPGHNLFLTIDSELQKVITEVLQEGLNGVGSLEGVAIVMNPNTGEVLAMVSLPAYDNNLFVGTIDPTQFQQLSENPQKPMFNRAISGVYPPGSIFKIIPAAGALADGIIDRTTTIKDPGIIYLPNENVLNDPALAMELAQPFVCWLETGHGDENVVDALAHSCDVFFYEVGGGYLDQFRGLGDVALAKWAVAFGLGEPTRIRLPGESSGHVPTRQWKRLSKQESWVTGDTYNMSIGQGDVLVTPLQILNATTAIANGGTLYEPQLVYQIQDAQGNVVQSFQPRVLRRANVPAEHLAIVAEGMHGATSWEDGTARISFRDVAVSVAGKTGTAEYCPVITKEDGTFDCKRDKDGNQLTHAWFTAFAPYENPEIALVVFVHGNGETVIQGSEVAAPIARRIIDYYFSQRPLDSARPVPPPPTPTMPPPVEVSPAVAPIQEEP
ncbi:MAG: penicillin-binding protein 2 [Ardenticatenales bacterium]|nr:penicillin-binding protein 2 [Ardenticatenales bacterium]